MADNTIDIRIDVEGNAKNQLKVLGASVNTFEKNTTNSLSVVGAAFASFTGNLAAAGVGAAFRLAAKGVSEFAGILKQGVALAQVQEDAVNKLNTALKLSGQFSTAASKELQDYASALQQTTKFGDEAIIETAALIQSLGQLDKEGLKKATAATLDLSAALGIDLNAAALLVGKAAAGEVSSFSRYGLVIKKGADNAETFATALDAINRKFGGAAAAQAETFSGVVDQLNNAYGDTLETLGKLVTENKFFIEGIKFAKEEIEKLDNFLKQNSETIRVFVNDGIIGSIKAFRAFIPIIASSALLFLKLGRAALVAKAGFDATAAGLKAVAIATVSRGRNTKSVSQSIIDAVKEESGAIDVLTKGIDGLGGAFKGLDLLSLKIVNRLKEIKTSTKALAEEDGPSPSKTKQGEVGLTDEQIQKEIEQLKKREAALRTIDAEGNAAEIETLRAHQELLSTALEVGSLRRLEIEAGFVESTKKLRESEAAAQIQALEEIAEETFVNDQALTISLLEESQRRTEALRDLDAEANAVEIELEKEHQQALINELEVGSTERLARQAKFNKTEIDKCEELRKKELTCEQRKAQAKVSILAKTFGALASLTQTGNRELFQIGKAAAISEAIINGIVSVTQAIRTPPGPPLTIPFGIAAGVAAAVQVQKIASQQFQAERGLTEVPGGFPNDSFPAALTSGERVVSAEQNRDLKQFLESNTGLSSRIDALIQSQMGSRPIVVQVDGSTILDVVQEQVDSGRTLNL